MTCGLQARGKVVGQVMRDAILRRMTVTSRRLSAEHPGGNRKDLSEEASAKIDLKRHHGSRCILRKDHGSQ